MADKTEQNSGELQEFKFRDENVKLLPRDKSGKLEQVFQANGNWYKITYWDNGVPIVRWHLYELFSISFAFNRDPVEIFGHNQKAEQMLRDILLGNTKKDPLDIIQVLKASREGLLELNPKRFNRAMYLCSLFIIGENEDVRTWSPETAEAKIKDWVAEGFSIRDFFTLAKSTADAILPNLKEFTENGLKEAETKSQEKQS